jgi:CRP-like cAMP-binding protein
MEGIARELARLPGAVTLSSLSPGTQLYAPGETSDHVYVLRSGFVKIHRVGRGGKHCIFGVVEPGDIFGEGALLEEGRRRAGAEVMEKASVAMVPRDAVLSYAESNPEFWQAFAPFLGRKVQLLEEQVQWLCFLEVEQRLARLLLQWARSAPSSDGGKEMRPIRLSQKELAGLVGATRETTSSALNRLQRAGCLEIGRRRLMVRSIERLAEFAGEIATPSEAASDETDRRARAEKSKAHSAGN